MLHYLLAGPPELDDPRLSDKTLAFPVQTRGADPISGRARADADSWADADVPVFALLRAQLGLPLEDHRWWPAGGRHVAFVPGGVPSPTAVSDPTIDLLERTLAGLRAWQPAALA